MRFRDVEKLTTSNPFNHLWIELRRFRHLKSCPLRLDGDRGEENSGWRRLWFLNRRKLWQITPHRYRFEQHGATRRLALRRQLNIVPWHDRPQLFMDPKSELVMREFPCVVRWNVLWNEVRKSVSTRITRIPQASLEACEKRNRLEQGGIRVGPFLEPIVAHLNIAL